jgi:Tripartite tricarboxylate transporter family receptor
MRSAQAPDIPTFAEVGLPALTYFEWTGLFAPKGTPREVIDKLNAGVVLALGDPACGRSPSSEARFCLASNKPRKRPPCRGRMRRNGGQSSRRSASRRGEPNGDARKNCGFEAQPNGKLRMEGFVTMASAKPSRLKLPELGCMLHRRDRSKSTGQRATGDKGGIVMSRLANTSCAAAIVAAVAALAAAPVLAGDITAEWANVTPPPAPELKQVTIDPKTTALLVLDFGKNKWRPPALSRQCTERQEAHRRGAHPQHDGRLYPPRSGT